MVRRWTFWTLMACATAFIACQAQREYSPARLRVTVLPDQTPELQHRQHDGLVRYLGAALGLPVDLIESRTYPDLSRMFHQHEVDLVYFGGLTFVNARKFDGALPLAMRDVDVSFTTTFYARRGRAPRTLADFRGKRFSFGSPESTSGHLMPRYFMQERGITPETFFSEVRYSGSHDKTAEWIGSGEVDLGAANTSIVEGLFDQGRLQRADFEVVWVTPTFSDYVWAVRPDLSAALQRRLRRAFLALTPLNPAHAAILADEAAGGFLPVRANEFDRLEAIAGQLGMLKSP